MIPQRTERKIENIKNRESVLQQASKRVLQKNLNKDE
jgi:hypothetical protein